jgi:hypothetical protein
MPLRLGTVPPAASRRSSSLSRPSTPRTSRAETTCHRFTLSAVVVIARVTPPAGSACQGLNHQRANSSRRRPGSATGSSTPFGSCVIPVRRPSGVRTQSCVTGVPS